MNSKYFSDLVRKRRGDNIIKYSEGLALKGERMAEQYLTLAMSVIEERYEEDINNVKGEFMSVPILNVSLENETVEIANTVRVYNDMEGLVHFNRESYLLYVFGRWIDINEMLPFLDSMEARGFDVRVDKNMLAIFPCFRVIPRFQDSVK